MNPCKKRLCIVTNYGLIQYHKGCLYLLCQGISLEPDIVGKYSTADRGTHANAENAFSSILTETTARFCEQVSVTPPSNGFAFDAKKSNIIYSNSTVQPPSFQIFIIIKI